jgi:hypothetical protein
MQMPRWERRIRIAIDWTLELFFKNDIVELDLFGVEHPTRQFQHHPLEAPKPETETIKS